MRDKKIREITQESLNTLKDDNFKRKLLLQQQALIDERATEKEKDRARRFSFTPKRLIASLTCFVVIGIIVCLGIFIPRPDDNSGEGAKVYYAENEMFENVGISDIVAVIKNSDINTDNISYPMVVKDKLSYDVLYYYFDYVTDLSTCRVKLLTNRFYNLEQKSTTQVVTVKDINISISADYSYEDEIYIHSVYGETVIDNVRVYFDEYTGYSLTEDSGFTQFVADLFNIAL